MAVFGADAIVKLPFIRISFFIDEEVLGAFAVKLA